MNNPHTKNTRERGIRTLEANYRELRDASIRVLINDVPTQGALAALHAIIASICPACEGTGTRPLFRTRARVFEKDCPICHGTGKRQEAEERE